MLQDLFTENVSLKQKLLEHEGKGKMPNQDYSVILMRKIQKLEAKVQEYEEKVSILQESEKALKQEIEMNKIRNTKDCALAADKICMLQETDILLKMELEAQQVLSMNAHQAVQERYSDLEDNYISASERMMSFQQPDEFLKHQVEENNIHVENKEPSIQTEKISLLQELKSILKKEVKYLNVKNSNTIRK